MHLLRKYGVLFDIDIFTQHADIILSIESNKIISITPYEVKQCFICKTDSKKYKYYSYDHYQCCKHCRNIIRNINKNVCDKIGNDRLYYLNYTTNFIILYVNEHIYEYNIKMTCNTDIIHQMLVKQKINLIIQQHKMTPLGIYKIMYCINKNHNINIFDDILLNYITELVEIVFLLKEITHKDIIPNIITMIINIKRYFI